MAHKVQGRYEVHLATWKELWDKKYPETKEGMIQAWQDNRDFQVFDGTGQGAAVCKTDLYNLNVTSDVSIVVRYGKGYEKVVVVQEYEAGTVTGKW